MNISEKLMEDLIAEFPHEFIEDGLTLIERQSVYGGPRIDLLFRDKFNRLLLIELKKGTLTREHIGQIHEYYAVIKNRRQRENLELMVVANNIPVERKRFLEELGVNFKEISEDRFFMIAKKYNKALESFEKERVHSEKHRFSEKKINAGDNIGILFCSKGDEHTSLCLKHLEKNKELYFSVGYPIRANKLVFPLTGLIHVSGPTGGEVRYKCKIKEIRHYHPSDHTDPSKKPEIWIIGQGNSPTNKYKTTMVIDKVEHFTYETMQLRDLQGNGIKRPPQNYQKILIPQKV